MSLQPSLLVIQLAIGPDFKDKNDNDDDNDEDDKDVDGDGNRGGLMTIMA